MPDDASALGARFHNPCLAPAAEHLTHVGVFAILGKLSNFSVSKRTIALHIAWRRVESAIDAILSREPDAPLAIESRGRGFESQKPPPSFSISMAGRNGLGLGRGLDI